MKQPAHLSRFVSSRLTVVIVSAGGSGTTTLMDFLRSKCATNDPGDADGYKHFPGPLVPLNPSCRFLYVFGDPVDVCVSLFRRGYASLQSRKLNRRLRGSPATIGVNETLDEYASAGVDRLGLESHFLSWFATPRPYPVGFVSYHALWTRLPEVLDFLSLPSALAQEFPERIARIGSQNVAPATLAQLEQLYAPLRQRLAGLDGFTLSPAMTGVEKIHAFSDLCLRAALPTLSWELSCRLPVFHRLVCHLHAAIRGRPASP